MPEPWASVLTGLQGPYGVIIAQGVVIFFLWRLFREKEKDLRTSDARISGITSALVALTEELRAKRR